MKRLWQRDRFGRVPTRPPSRRVSTADKRRLQALLHQQLWCWGRDVAEGPSGNLLVWAGMARHGPDTPGVPGSNRYSIGLSDGCEISLWAFGVGLRQHDDWVFVHRYKRGVWLLPRSWRPGAVRVPDELPAMHRPRTADESNRSARLLGVMLAWIAEYERAVLARFGPTYRTQTLTDWKHIVIDGPAMADEWRRLAGVYHQDAGHSPLPPRTLERTG
ncbi:MAG: hypothetical protein AAF743_03025 [Planctomycetota bacterium]